MPRPRLKGPEDLEGPDQLPVLGTIITLKFVIKALIDSPTNLKQLARKVVK
jgi:hypothetical protein